MIETHPSAKPDVHGYKSCFGSDTEKDDSEAVAGVAKAESAARRRITSNLEQKREMSAVVKPEKIQKCGKVVCDSFLQTTSILQWTTSEPRLIWSDYHFLIILHSHVGGVWEGCGKLLWIGHAPSTSSATEYTTQ